MDLTDEFEEKKFKNCLLKSELKSGKNPSFKTKKIKTLNRDSVTTKILQTFKSFFISR